jgi:hypothetical protein
MRATQLRSPGAKRSLLAGLALVVVLLGPPGAAAPTAHANATDDAFLAAIKAKGINFTTPEAAIVAAHEVCDELDIGRAKSDVASEVMTNSNLDGYHAGYFVGASVKAYCPSHSG